MKLFYLCLSFISFWTFGYGIQKAEKKVNIVGSMRSVMREGQLQGKIQLSEIPLKAHLYGLGPVEYLKGELLILDGKSFKSSIISNGSMKVVEVDIVKAPFFAYENIENWTIIPLPASIKSIKDLETYLDSVTKTSRRPFIFRLQGMVKEARIHVVNLPEGAKVSSPSQAHAGRADFTVTNEMVEIVGFFSIEHKTVFTHHDTFLHMHLITTKRTQMGHLDGVEFVPGTIKLYLPVD